MDRRGSHVALQQSQEVLCMFMVPVPFKTDHGVGEGGGAGETCTRGGPQCFREGRRAGRGLCHCEEAAEWQQLASEESTNHKNDHILDKETNGETT